MALSQGVDLFGGSSTSPHQNWGFLLCPCKSGLHCPDHLWGVLSTDPISSPPHGLPSCTLPKVSLTQARSPVIFVSYLVPSRAPQWLSGKRIHLQDRRFGFDSWVGKTPWRRKWQLTLVFLPGEAHGQRSLVGSSSCGHKESDTTERFTFWAFQMALVVKKPLASPGDPGD